jgi:hypothetical protein
MALTRMTPQERVDLEFQVLRRAAAKKVKGSLEQAVFADMKHKGWKESADGSWRAPEFRESDDNSSDGAIQYDEAEKLAAQRRVKNAYRHIFRLLGLSEADAESQALECAQLAQSDYAKLWIKLGVDPKTADKFAAAELRPRR